MRAYLFFLFEGPKKTPPPLSWSLFVLQKDAGCAVLGRCRAPRAARAGRRWGHGPAPGGPRLGDPGRCGSACCPRKPLLSVPLPEAQKTGIPTWNPGGNMDQKHVAFLCAPFVFALFFSGWVSSKTKNTNGLRGCLRKPVLLFAGRSLKDLHFATV